MGVNMSRVGNKQASKLELSRAQTTYGAILVLINARRWLGRRLEFLAFVGKNYHF